MIQKQIKEYDILRVVVTVLVILGHITYLHIETNGYGLCDYSVCAEQGLSVLYKMATYMKKLIYSFHMPLYMMLSGALFRYTKSCGGGYCSSLRSLSVKKAKNLLIPFIVVTLFYVVPLKYLSGYYFRSESPFRDILVGQFLLQGNNHLWFLPTLYLIFLLVELMDGQFSRGAPVKLAILFIVSCLSDFIPIALISMPLTYAFWFYAGCLFEDKRETIGRHIKRHPLRLVLITGIWMVLAVIDAKLRPTRGILFLIEKVLSAACVFAGSYSTYGGCCLLAKTEISEHMAFRHIRRNTLGLYLYSDPLNYVILFLGVKWFGSSVFTTNFGSLCLLSLRFVLTTVIAYGVSCLARRLHLKFLY